MSKNIVQINKQAIWRNEVQINGKTFSAARHKQILSWLAEEGLISIKELQNRMNVSHMTVHRDLDFLAKNGHVIKVRGGVSAAGVQESNAITPKSCSMCGGRVAGRTEVVIQMQNGNRIFACCPHCGIMLLKDRETSESALGRDYLYGRMVNIFQAAYIVDSDIQLCCVPSTLCFAEAADAQRFQLGFGGHLLNFNQTLQHLSDTHHHEQH